MFFTKAAILGLAAMVAAQGNSDFGHCDHNACLQQVHHEAVGHRTGSADCSSFLSVTVTPAASTTTVVDTVTVTTTTVVGPGGSGGPVLRARRRAARVVAPRQVTATPTAIPAYASGCTNPTAYASACSCIGVTGGATTTAPAPPDSTVFSTTTTTETVTSTSSPPAPQLTVGSYDSAPGVCEETQNGPTLQVITTDGCASVSSNNIAFDGYVPAPGCSTCLVEFYLSTDCSGPPNFQPSPQDPNSNTCYNRWNPYGPVPIIYFNSVKLVCFCPGPPEKRDLLE
ncbi:hypothetical protein QBC37DRAFT_393547 [Rhypophila decipiens]|uniref:Uncharacterized protein n=1 Tax=Rhypophila decipiens TaxID=261697 RepID=A0AAN7AYN3_9PEZI|nr:hypothetical protein QBC37DRAFT_393547 [Rhypophila decipiens]